MHLLAGVVNLLDMIILYHHQKIDTSEFTATMEQQYQHVESRSESTAEWSKPWVCLASFRIILLVLNNI